ncbi:hypothetical protein A1O1_05982 [Capronia coronata CBS 617.96]|uniref:Apple domain-containing protein n=1 Tax=Capronia coronata CBS 617.96 TaxID=1182541 RepID=W9Y8P4_9EURO|nr:uncharacterized protein A1O1_05982 [Capronia coronata CBS 617.96]EXJ85616.1 hypothetical protein A1O1_05982 [Capronia coronata CBS 617.96]
MDLSHPIVGYMLILCTFMCPTTLASVHPRDALHSHRALDGQTLSTSTVKQAVAIAAGVTVLPPAMTPATPCTGTDCASPSLLPDILPCNAANGTTLLEQTRKANYTILCDIDYPDQNIYPFVPAGSFQECLTQCEIRNQASSAGSHCAGFVFAPDRVHEADNCYLKSSVEDPIPATIHLVGATLVSPSSSTSCASETASRR